MRPGAPGMEQEISVREKGVVKWFNAAKGYGFIQRSSGEDVFVHFSAVQMSGYRTLEEGAEVEFEVKTGPKGLQAENVNRPYALRRARDSNNLMRGPRARGLFYWHFPRGPHATPLQWPHAVRAVFKIPQAAGASGYRRTLGLL